jgi:hypothetical protein
METSATIGKIAKALSQAQAEIKGAVKDSDNHFFKSKYADLSSVWDACREVLPKNGLSVFQTGDGSTADTVSVVTMIAHESGEWVRGSVTMKLSKCDPQGAVGGLTYGRRAGLAAMVGVCPEDDDGEIASGKGKGLSKAQERPGFNTGKPVAQFDAEQAAKPQSDLGTFEDFIVSVEKGQSGATAKGPWQAYRIMTKENDIVGTYSVDVAHKCRRAQEIGAKVKFDCEPSKHGPKAVAAMIIEFPQ